MLAGRLASVGTLNYPDYEVILGNDGSSRDTGDTAAQFPDVPYTHQANLGLSHPRNTGTAAAKGDVLAYTDSDCMADVERISYLIGALVRGAYAGAGGPNITPTPQYSIQACVSATPVSIRHVLFMDMIV